MMIKTSVNPLNTYNSDYNFISAEKIDASSETWTSDGMPYKSIPVRRLPSWWCSCPSLKTTKSAMARPALSFSAELS